MSNRKDQFWLKGIGKISEPILVNFIKLWDECTSAQRVEFLRTYTPHLNEWEIEEYSQRPANKLPHGALAGLCMIFEDEMRAEE